jgi:hypothetical protein
MNVLAREIRNRPSEQAVPRQARPNPPPACRGQQPSGRLQRPGSANGVLFITLEDETEIANLIIWPSLFDRQRRLILSASMVGCRGKVQREGEVIHVIAEHLTDLSGLLGGVGERDEAFPLPHGRGDEAKNGGGPDSRQALGRKPRDIYIPDLRIEAAINVKTRDVEWRSDRWAGLLDKLILVNVLGKALCSSGAAYIPHDRLRPRLDLELLNSDHLSVGPLELVVGLESAMEGALKAGDCCREPRRAPLPHVSVDAAEQARGSRLETGRVDRERCLDLIFWLHAFDQGQGSRQAVGCRHQFARQHRCGHEAAYARVDEVP